MLSITLSSLWARRRRLVGTGVAVVLGVAFLVGTLVLGDTLGKNFERLFSDVSAGTDVVVRNATTVDASSVLDGNRGLIDQSLVATVTGVDGVAAVEPEVTGYGALIGRDGDAVGGNGPPRIAASWVTDPQLNPYRLVEGRAPAADDEVVINLGAATAGHLAVGDHTVVQTPDPTPVTIVGIVTFGDADGFGTATFAGFTLAGAQANVTHQPGMVSSILVRAAPGVSSTELAARVTAATPSGVQVITGTQLAAERVDAVNDAFLGFLRTFVTAFAVIALLVATLSINNTFSITVAQRTRELGLMRAVGASRRQVRALVALEALAVGLGASIVGVVAGLGVAGLLKGLFDAVGGALPAGGLQISPVSVAVGLGVGTAVTVLASQLPARPAARVAPIAALRDEAEAARPLGVGRVLAGVALVAAGGAVAVLAATGGALALTGLGALGLVAGVLLLAPVVVGPAARAAGVVLRRRRDGRGLLAEENIRRNPRRSAATATALVVGVSVVALFTVFAASMNTALGDRVTSAFAADLAVNSGSFRSGGISPQILTELGQLPEVQTVVGVGGGTVLLDGVTETVTAADPARLDGAVAVRTTAGSLAGLGDDGIAVGASRAGNEHWSVGTPVTLTLADGAVVPLTVRAIYADNQLLGPLLVTDGLWAAHTTQPTERTAFVTLRPGVSGDAARAAITPIAQRYSGDVQDRAEFVAASTQGLDMLLGIVYVLLALAVVIALLGIANTLSLAVYERRREIGLLRAVGQTRRQVRSVVRLEAVVLAGFGTVLGLALGGFLGWSLFGAVSDTAGFTLPVTPLVVIVVLCSAAGALAAIRPARRASHVAILDAIAAP